jgi:putative flippase GtrA
MVTWLSARRWVYTFGRPARRAGPAYAPYTAPVRLLRLLLARLTTPWRVLLKEMSAFGVVGAVNLFVDIGLFNLLHFRVGLGPTTSNVLSTGTATTISYFGNRHWSFSHRARTGLRREYSLFILINLLALGLSSVVVAGSFYLLGLTSPLALNIAKFVGIVLGTVFRFWSYKRWVFPPHPEPAEPVKEPAAA